ncbi:MAG: disulfide isomerase DsbC N-terminal domain-containing protein [Gammaproteobacteria bacterium]
MRTRLTLLIGCALLGAMLFAHAGNNTSVEARLAKQLGLKPAAVTPSPIPGLYRITIGPAVAYASADGRYLIRGDIIDMNGGENLTANQRAQARLAYLTQLAPSDMIVFAPSHPKHTITVLTDIDCEYCRVLEHDRPALNAMGITVRYLSYPRDGEGSASWQKAVDVWCAKDRKTAFESAMNGRTVKSAKCNSTAVAAGYQFGQMLGLDGTPAIITEHGQLIDGYLPPSELESALGIAPQSARKASH